MPTGSSCCARTRRRWGPWSSPARTRRKPFPPLRPEAFRELHQISGDIERNLAAFRPFRKINYLMLMMVDKDVHFHVLPPL